MSSIHQIAHFNYTTENHSGICVHVIIFNILCLSRDIFTIYTVCLTLEVKCRNCRVSNVWRNPVFLLDLQHSSNKKKGGMYSTLPLDVDLALSFPQTGLECLLT